MKGDHILLQRRENTGHGDGKLSLVGGHVDPGEAPVAALCREAMEEIGIQIQPEDARCVYTLFRKNDGEERVDTFFMVTQWKGKITILEPQKCSELAFFSVKRLPSDTLPYIQSTLKNIQRGKIYGEIGW